MVQKPKLTLKIQNENYAEFNGFEISFSGFDKLPYLMSSPLGFTAGKYILEKLKQRFGEFKLTIARDKSSSVEIYKVPVEIIFKYDDLRTLGREFRANYTLEGRRTVAKHLSTLFPEDFEIVGLVPLFWTTLIIWALNFIFGLYSPKKTWKQFYQ